VSDLLKKRDESLAAQEWPEIVRAIRARTPARILVGRAGAAYRTTTQLDLRDAHAAARDAVRDELDLNAAFGAEFVKRWEMREYRTRARAKNEYLLRPDLGRQFDDESRARLLANGERASDIQIAIGDGLSVAAVAEQVPNLLPLLFEGATARGWSAGRTLAHTDADRNLISNIHARGVSAEEAAARILEMAARMMSAGMSGVQLREESRRME
jgi:ethanolamine ammonia-lyase small subunit